MIRAGVVLAGALVLPGCPRGGDTPPTPTRFADMNADQRLVFMRDVVMPETKALFAAFDPELPEATCETCHGEGVDDESFEMPNDGLEALPNTPEAFKAWVAVDAEAARWGTWMGETFTPRIAELLGRTPFNPATESGDFSCDACHTLTSESKLPEPGAAAAPSATPHD
jgi:hypothetical protein